MRKSLLLMMVLLLASFPVFAQDNGEWSAYLYDYINSDLIRLSSDADSQSYSLGVPEGGLIFSLSINEDGSQVAYCYAYPDASVEWINKLVIRDIDQESNILEQDIWSGFLDNCAITAFKTDVLALSLVYPYNHDKPAENRWELRLIDTLTGENLAVLDSDNPAIPEYRVFDWVNLPITAKVRELSRERVSFMAIPYIGADIPPYFEAFEWNLSADTVSQLPAAFGHLNSDYLPETGEVVYAMLDESLPAAIPSGPMYQANVVKILDAEGERTIYQSSEWVIDSPTFVNNGQSVLVKLFPGYDEQNPEGMDLAFRYILLNRDGSAVEFAEEFAVGVSVDSIPNGAIFVYTPQLSSGELDTTEILLLGSDGTLSFYSDVTVDYTLGWSPPQLVWTSPSTADADLAAFVGL